MKRKSEGIYTTQGGQMKLIATRARINGVLSVAYVKDGELISHEPWESFSRQVLTGPCLEFVTES